MHTMVVSTYGAMRARVTTGATISMWIEMEMELETYLTTYQVRTKIDTP